MFGNRPTVVFVVALNLLMMGWLSTPAATAQSAPTVAPKSAVIGHFVVLGAGTSGATVAYARAVIEPGWSCPSVVGGATAVPMTPRDNPHFFPVVVCEAKIGFGQTLQLQLEDGTLPVATVRKNPQRVLAFGDTGCKRGTPGGGGGGCLPGAPAEPFGSLARAAATGPAPDLLLHMGDYNYRGTPSSILFTTLQDGEPVTTAQWNYDAGDGTSVEEGCLQNADAGFYSQNAPNGAFPDLWSAWRDDFFAPARDLLPKAPWVFARGNHELCSRAGPGWFYFLDASSNLDGAQQRCPVPDPARAPIDNVVLSAPYAVDLGSLTVLVLDSANACDAFLNDTFTARYTQQMQTLAGETSSSGATWLVTHRPIWGVTGFTAGESTGCTAANQWGCINQTLQAALRNAGSDDFLAALDLHLAGHMHRFQTLTFQAPGRPPVIVVGNGGVALDDSPPVGPLALTVDGEPVKGASLGSMIQIKNGGSDPAFGYLDATVGPDGQWQGQVRNPVEGVTLARCGSRFAARGQVCRLPSGEVPPVPPPTSAERP